MKEMSGRSALMEILKDEGVEYLFGNPGTTELPLMDTLTDHPELKYVLGLQESVAMGMADGYSRVSGKLSAVNLHVAAGLGNAIGAIFNAKFFGSPVLVTAGQQEHGLSLTEPMLYDDLVKMAAPVTKWATEVARVQDLPRVFRRAAKVALTPPTGPVFVSLPRDVIMASAELELGAPTRVDAGSQPNPAALEALADRLLKAERPMIVAGHEVFSSDAFVELGEVANLLGAAVYAQTVNYVSTFPTDHPLFMGELTRIQTQTRAILEQFDLMLDAGSDNLRMANPSTVEPLPPGMPVIQIGSRDWELGKNYPAVQALRADVKVTLAALIPILKARRTAGQAKAAADRAAALKAKNWSVKRDALVAKTQGKAAVTPVAADFLMMCIAQAVPKDAVILEEGLTSTRTLLNFLDITHRQRFFGLASGGIGFAIAGAVGVQLAVRQRPVVAVIGDGSAMYSIQALWTAAHLRLPITFVIINNRSYRILKERVFALKGPAAAKDQYLGMDFRDPPIDFQGLSKSLGVPARQVTSPGDVMAALHEAIAVKDGPRLVEVLTEDGFKG